ncbi:class I SAM-dependent methyltransferase [Amycolatopsis minnesotensis]|uniref:Methyltransferase domain-containing protein n=1 Tax=Amycolatopsis minnesotensis TaxID=337894 RepID=A0ABP5CIJ2_9PSEU
MDPVATRMRELYDRRAADYVATTGEVGLFPGLDAELARFVQRMPGGGPVLDLGSGVGRDADWFSRRGLSVVAVDFSEQMLRITGARSPEVAVVQAELTNLPFRDDRFAGAWVCASLVHLASAGHPRALAEVFRTLQPSGAVAISMKVGHGEGWATGSKLPDERWFSYVDADEFAGLMRAVGFVGVTTIPSGRDTWFIAEGIKPGRLGSTRPDDSSGGFA